MKKNKTYWKKKADNEWKRVIRERDLYACRYCQETEKQLHAHHIIGRRITQIRYNLDNGLLLCASHHTLGKFSAHENSIGFNEWIKEEIGEELYEALKAESYKINKLPHDFYEQEYKRLKEMKCVQE